ncbi:MAG: hypothetical protein KKE23_01755 [Nanoarchaeota archaeon]|nr:hypothetical protein [Nanoarchaeota archaeon]
MAYLLSKRGNAKIEDGLVVKLSPDEAKNVDRLSKREIALRSRGLAISNPQGVLVERVNKTFAQHYYPLSITDYAEAAYKNEKSNQQFPILSIDAHDVIGCDFKCQDCLSHGGLNVQSLGIHNFDLPIELYTHILSEISNFSSKRGFSGVKFEQSGEGNPDIFPKRAELIRLSKQRFGMNPVYVTTGSKADEDLLESLAENASFVRFSFPGLDQRSYNMYSGQSHYLFNDAIEKIKKVIKKRGTYKRERDLLIGIRAPLRPEHEYLYSDFAKKIKDLGADAVQFVKILIPEDTGLAEHLLSEKAREDIIKAKSLSGNDFSVALPHELDYIYYGRAIKDKESFPDVCYSSYIHPVLTGRDLFVCTMNEKIYSLNYSFGRFTGRKGEIEDFLSKDNLARMSKDIPKSCNACCSLFDNLLINKVKQITRKKINEELKFYEVIE